MRATTEPLSAYTFNTSCTTTTACTILDTRVDTQLFLNHIISIISSSMIIIIIIIIHLTWHHTKPRVVLTLLQTFVKHASSIRIEYCTKYYLGHPTGRSEDQALPMNFIFFFINPPCSAAAQWMTIKCIAAVQSQVKLQQLV